MKKFLCVLILIGSLIFCLCACDSDKNTDSQNSGNNTSTQATDNAPTQVKLEVQTPGNKTFDVSADDIKVESKDSINPNVRDFKEITDPDAKVKIYNMLRNALECEQIDYSERERANGSTYLRVKLTTANGEYYRIYLGKPKNNVENFSVQGSNDGNYLLDEEFVSEFYELLEIEQPIISQ